jgi:predicted RNase H-like HicB family nuclease
MRYPIKLLQSDEGYAVWCPLLPGCCSQGNTESEALENIEFAIKEYLSVVAELNREGELRYIDLEVEVA